MKKINIIKITLDIIMTIVFVLLYNRMVIYGLTFHEIAGLAIGAVFVIHIALNWKWIKQVTSNILSKKVSHKTRIGYLVDVLLLFAMVYIIISGILISKVVLPNLGLGNVRFFNLTHVSVSYAALLLIGIHLGLHWDWVMNTFKRIFKITQRKKVLNLASKAAVILVLAFGIYSIYSTSYFTRLLPIVGGIADEGYRQGMERGIEESPDADGERGQFEDRRNNGEVPDRRESGEGAPGGRGSREGIPDGEGLPDDARGFPADGRGPAVNGNGLLGVNPLNVIATNLGIIAVFAVFTFYIKKLLVRKRTKKSADPEVHLNKPAGDMEK